MSRSSEGPERRSAVGRRRTDTGGAFEQACNPLFPETEARLCDHTLSVVGRRTAKHRRAVHSILRTTFRRRRMVETAEGETSSATHGRVGVRDIETTSGSSGLWNLMTVPGSRGFFSRRRRAMDRLGPWLCAFHDAIVHSCAARIVFTRNRGLDLPATYLPGKLRARFCLPCEPRLGGRSICATYLWMPM